MKNKIRLRLLLYFSGSLLAFSLVIGLVFFSLFSRHNMDVHKAELGNRAVRIAAQLAGYWSGDPEHSEQRHGQGHGMAGHGQGQAGAGLGQGQGQNVSGENTSGQDIAGQSTTGRNIAGQNGADQNEASQNRAGENEVGQNPPGQPIPGQHTAGQNPSGQPIPGQHMAGQNAPEQSIPEQRTNSAEAGQNPPGRGPEGQGPGGSGGPGMGSGAYLRFLEDIAMTDIWIVDRNLEQVERSHGQKTLSYKDLPPGAEEVVLAALQGRTTFSESFGTFIGAPSITVATPITFADGWVAGAVLLHENIKNIHRTTANGLIILLLSIGAAIIIAFFIANALAGHFTKPLDKMKTAAQKISSGDYSATTGVAQDDEIGALAVALDDMAVKLKAASRESAKLEKLRRDFVANISHELRTPVTVIRGSLEALTDGVVTKPDQVADYHQQMLTESVYLERLVTDLLSLARLQNPDFAIEMQEVNLKEIAADALRGMRRPAGSKNITLQLNAANGDYTMHGDYGRLRQMLVIVLDNAIKFSPEGSAVQLNMKHTAAGISFSVKDTGRGIPPEELPYIFERFYRQRPEENKSGTGLGLAIARQIAERHNMTITVQSTPGRGTEFIFAAPTPTKPAS